MSKPEKGLNDSLTRREALKYGVLGTASLAFNRQLVQPTLSASLPVKAKSVIQIWMWGGPCHLDTFDPKPEAGRDYCGPLDKPISTKVSGIRISEGGEKCQKNGQHGEPGLSHQ